MNRRRKPKVGNQVEALLGFLTVADAEHDFALKLDAEDGNWDLAGSNARASRRSYTERPEEKYSHDRRKR